MQFLTEQIDGRDAAVLDRLVKAYARPGMVVCELGTYTGRSSMVMLPSIRAMDGTLYCVDWFQGNPGVQAEITTSYQDHDVLRLFLANVKEGGYERYVNVIVGTTDRVAPAIADGITDIVFIDADHRYSSIKNDIVNWYPKIRAGGLICGHDFERHLRNCDSWRVFRHCEEDFVDGCHYGVIRAVSEFFPDVAWEGRIWYAQKGGSFRPRLDYAVAQRRRRWLSQPVTTTGFPSRHPQSAKAKLGAARPMMSNTTEQAIQSCDKNLWFAATVWTLTLYAQLVCSTLHLKWLEVRRMLLTLLRQGVGPEAYDGLRGWWRSTKRTQGTCCLCRKPGFAGPAGPRLRSVSRARRQPS